MGALETGVEWAGTRLFGSASDRANFSFLGSLAKNTAINFVTGGFGKIGFAGRQGLEILGDTAYDIGVGSQSLGSSLAMNTVGSLGGELVGWGLQAGAKRLWSRIVFDSSCFKSIGDVPDWSLRALSASDKRLARTEIITMLMSGTSTEFARTLGSSIRSPGGTRLIFAELPGRQIGGIGKIAILIDARLIHEAIATGSFGRVSATVVHEGQHLADDLTGRLSRFSMRRGEFRAISQELFFSLSHNIDSEVTRVFLDGGFGALASWAIKRWGL